MSGPIYFESSVMYDWQKRYVWGEGEGSVCVVRVRTETKRKKINTAIKEKHLKYTLKRKSYTHTYSHMNRCWNTHTSNHTPHT